MPRLCIASVPSQAEFSSKCQTFLAPSCLLPKPLFFGAARVTCCVTSTRKLRRRLFTLVIRRPYCPGRPKELSFTTLSLAMETMGMRLSVVKQSFFGPPGQYGRLVTRANSPPSIHTELTQRNKQVNSYFDVFF